MSTPAVTSATSNRVVLDYTSRDYKAIRAMLVGLAKGLVPDWRTVGETGDFGTLLLELYAYTGDITNYYIDRMASEAFLGTAIRRQSILYIADMFGYAPIGQRASTVPLSFTWEFVDGNINTKSYAINTATCVNGLVTMNISNSTYAVTVVQGQTLSISGAGVPYDGQVVVTSVKDTENTSKIITYTGSALTGTAITSTPSGSSVVTGSVVVIPAGTFITTNSDANGVTTAFELDFSVTLDSAAAKTISTSSISGITRSITQTATASEGITIEPTKAGTSKGIPNAEFRLANPGVIDRTVQVYTKEGGQVLPWALIGKMSLGSPTQSVFTTYVDDNNYTHVLFGDNASGRIPPANTDIYVGYRYGTGAASNALGVDTVVNINNSFANQVGVTVTNTSAPVGGADVETVESMRYSIPRSNALKQRAVTLEDYINLALQVPGVSKATAYGENYTSVYVRVASNAQSTGYDTAVASLKSVTSNVATLALDSSLYLNIGQTFYASGTGTATLDGAYTVKSVYNPTDAVSITTISQTGTVASITLSSAGGFSVGQTVFISGVTAGTSSRYNGNRIITGVSGAVLTFNTATGTLASTTPATSGATVKGSMGFTYDVSATANTTTPVAISPTGLVTITSQSMQLLINSLESYLSDKKLIGSVVYGEPVEWTNVTIDIDTVVLPLYNRESVRAAVQKAVEAVLAFDNVDFGKRISIGDIYRAALGVDGVEYVTLNTLKVKDAAGSVPVDINTPPYNIPRIDPNIDIDWATATGGLVNT